MSIFIGGLLVLSLLLRPSVATNDTYYLLFLQKVPGIHLRKKEDEDDESQNYFGDIDELFEQITDATREIRTLLKEDAKHIARIQAMLDLYEGQKIVMNDEKVMAVIEFNQSYKERKSRLKEMSSLVTDETFDDLKLKIMDSKSDKLSIFKELEDFLGRQNNIIEVLKEMVGLSDKTLAII